jgi:hypothetical protein
MLWRCANAQNPKTHDAKAKSDRRTWNKGSRQATGAMAGTATVKVVFSMKEIRPITKREIKEALSNKSWDLGNQVLYDLCSKHPNHKTNEEIIAKVWLIGRTYSAAIERRKNKDLDTPGDLFYEDKVAPAIKHSKVDDWLNSLTDDSIPEKVIEIHAKLTKLFFALSKLEKRSLVSKYLHFHRPNLFFIFDSRSAAAIRKVTPRRIKDQPSNLSTKEADKNYADFYWRCLWLQENLPTRLGGKYSPREIDKILLHVANPARKNGEPKPIHSAKAAVCRKNGILVHHSERSISAQDLTKALTGNLEGKIEMSPDFDSPLEDFKDYMK